MLAVLGAGAVPATAADPAPTPPAFTPPPLPDPSDPAYRGPTYVITPGVGGSALPAPSDPREVAKARQADRSRHTAAPARSGPGARARAGPVTAGPQSPLAPTAGSGEKVGIALRGFAALVALVVLCEAMTVGRTVFGRRKGSVTAG